MAVTTYVALLRGINVGGSHTVPMRDLRDLVAGAGGEDVATYLQSGNVVFRATGKASQIVDDLESRLAQRFGFDIPVIVRTKAEMARVVATNPWPRDGIEPTKLVVVFYQTAPKAAAFSSIDAAAFEPERFVLTGRELYLHLPGGQGRSKLAAAINRQKLAPPGTARNWNSVTALAEKAAGL